MAVITFQPPSNVCNCTLTVGGQSSQQVPVQEISALGAVVAFQGSVRRHEYADVAVYVQGKEVLTLFAHIVNVRSEVVHLRWLHLGPGEAESLAMQLANIFSGVDGVQRGEAANKDYAWRQEQGTRRIVRPRTGAKPSPVPPEPASPEPASPEPAVSERRSTRKVVRPRSAKESDTDIDLEAVADDAEEDVTRSKRETRRVVRPRQGHAASQSTPESVGDEEGDQLSRKTRRVVKPRHQDQAGKGRQQAAASSGDMPSARARATVLPREQDSADDDENAPSSQLADAAQVGDDHALQPRQPASGDKPVRDAQEPVAPQPSNSADAGTNDASSPDGNWRQGSQSSEATDDQLALVKTERLAKMPAPAQPHGESDASADAKSAVVHRDAASQKILSRARTVQASELAARHDKVRVLNMSTIKELIKESVAEAMVDMNTGMDASRLAEEVERRVDEQLQAFKAEKDDVEARAQRLEAELQKAKEAVEREQKRAIEANQFTISDAGIADIERRLERLVAAAIRRNGVNDVLADELRAMVTHILDDERDKIADNARKAQAETIQLLERKINRLSSSLDESQKDQLRAKRMLEAMQQTGGGGALRNVMTAGLSDDDPEAERKKDLMRDIMAQNRAIRDQMKEKGMEVRSRKPAPEPVDPVDDSPHEPHDASPPDHEASASGADADPGDDDSAEIIDPDDMPWEGPPQDAEEDDRPIKRLAVSVKSAAAKAPPLQIRRRESDAAAPPADEHDRMATEVDDKESVTEVDASPDMDPDDMPWEPPSDDLTSGEAGEAPIKRIAVSKDIQPPPLERGT
ncbi:MAG: hypothetical protein EA401_02775 [Planctomycetota bacterium]|nr:MAG: hypothetical protein EA401_02775 [Planctomycetota bacterium]